MADSELSEPGEFFECFGIDFVVHECLQVSLPNLSCARIRNISSVDTYCYSLDGTIPSQSRSSGPTTRKWGFRISDLLL